MKRRGFIAGILGAGAAAPVAAHVDQHPPAPRAIGVELICAARKRYGDIELQWAFGPRDGSAVYGVPERSDGLHTQPLNDKSVPTNCAILYGARIERSPNCFALLDPDGGTLGAGNAVRIERVYCGRVNLKTGEIGYGLDNG